MTVEQVLVGLDVMLKQRETKTDRILGRINVLMEHFFVAQTGEKVTAAKFMDWYEALKKYPFWAIDEACKNWLLNNSKKPVIANINTLCITAMEEPHRMQQRLKIISAPIGPEPKKEGKTWGQMTQEERDRFDENLIKIKTSNAAGANFMEQLKVNTQ